MANYFSDELLEEVKNANDIVDVVSEYVKLKRSGRNYFGVCPFHSEKTPSFSVSPDKQIFHCFGCGTGGNVIRFIEKIENLDFIEAVKSLAERARIQLPESGAIYKPEQVLLKEKLFEINLEAAKYFYNTLMSAKASVAREYLKKRGITGEVATKFGLGFAYGINNDLCNFLMNKGYTEELIIAAGLGNSDKTGKLHDKFRARIMFPIMDVRNKTIGFGGRVLDNSLPKYLNSPETIIFNKRKNLYGLNLAKKSEERKVILVEGYMDAISLYQHGVNNVVASLGTSFTQEQGRLLRKYFDEIIISYDSDAAGQSAALRGLDMLTEMDIPVRVMKVVDSKDPDEYVRKFGAKRFKELAASAKSLAEFKIDNLRGQYDINDVRQRINFVNKTADVLSKVQNEIERDVYIKQVSGETGIGADAIYSEVGKLTARNYKAQKLPNTLKMVRKASINKNDDGIPQKVLQAEKMLVVLMSQNDKEITDYLKKNVNFDYINSKIIKGLIEKIEKLSASKKDFSCSDIIDILEDGEETNTFTDIMQREVSTEEWKKISDDLIETLGRARIESRKREILQKISNPDLKDEELHRLEEELKLLTIQLLQMKKK